MKVLRNIVLPFSLHDYDCNEFSILSMTNRGNSYIISSIQSCVVYW